MKRAHLWNKSQDTQATQQPRTFTKMLMETYPKT